MFHKKSKTYYYAKVQSEVSKNHQRDDEDLELGGIIPFTANNQGLNAGHYIELFCTFLNPENEFFFQKPKRAAKKFNIHSPSSTVYFENSKVGVTFVAAMMPKLCEALKLPRRFTNCSIRTTTIRTLKRAGHEDRAIMNVSGHKSVDVLRYICYGLYFVCFSTSMYYLLQ